MPPKATRADRLRLLRTWVSEHASTLRARGGATLQNCLRQKGGLPEEKSWYDFLHRNTFVGAEAAQLDAVAALVLRPFSGAEGGAEKTPAKRQRTEDVTPGRLQVSPLGQAVTPSRTPAHLRTPPVGQVAPDVPEPLVLSPAAAVALAQCRRGAHPQILPSPSVAQRSQSGPKLVLDEVRDVRDSVRQLCSGLLEFQRAAPGQLPSQYGKDKALYAKMKNVRKVYHGNRHSPLTADEGRLLAAADPQIFGKGALGIAEKHGAAWRWTFEAAGYDVYSDGFESEEAAKAELLLLQSKLYPGWEQKSQRRQHLERLRCLVKQDRQQAQALEAPAMEAFRGRATAALEDLRLAGDRLQNAFPGFRNLGNTCYLNALLQCVFHCHPLCDYLVAEDPRSSLMGNCVRAALQEYLSTEGFVHDVLTPAELVKQVVQQCSYVAGRQQDPAETLHRMFDCLDQGAMHTRLCCTGADAELTGIVQFAASEHAEAEGLVF